MFARSSILFVVALLCCCAEGARLEVHQMMNSRSSDVMRDDEPPMSMTPSTTVSGCTCKASSLCGATITGSFACDRCRVEGKCGQKGWLLGNWDYCAYPKMGPYESQSASQKRDQLWNKITAEDAIGQSAPAKSILGVVTTIIGESMRTPFDNHWDVMPEGRTKVIHTQGVHCKFELDVGEGSPYTGLFATGQSEGIIRMGSANSLDASGKPPFPGLSFKFLRDGVHSGNFVALRGSGDEGGGYAFFDEEFTKIVNPPAALKALMKFNQASDCQSMVGLSDLCAFDQAGIPVEKVKFPYDIRFEASSDAIYLPDVKITDEELLSHLSSIEAGTHLFNVFAKDSPTAEKARLGTLKTTSQCVRSLFGDQNLFFRHQRMEEDFVREPDWVKTVTAPGCEPTAQPSSKWQCPGVH